MNCLDARRLINSYLNDQLSCEETERFLEHIESCSACYDELEIYYTIHYMLGHDTPATNTDDGTAFDISRELKADIDTHWMMIRKNKRKARFFILMTILSEAVLAASAVVSFIPQDYKDILMDVIEFFSW